MISPNFKCDEYTCDLRDTLFPDLDILNLIGRTMLLALRLIEPHNHEGTPISRLSKGYLI